MSKYTLEIKETPDGELYFILPEEILDNLGWEEGDEVQFIEKDNSFIIKKVDLINLLSDENIS
jgi:bifunctional DNA-binding transcriptional regulator/antitoxin component of YhaV-PrlF toxin-antitoxin module